MKLKAKKKYTIVIGVEMILIILLLFGISLTIPNPRSISSPNRVDGSYILSRMKDCKMNHANGSRCYQLAALSFLQHFSLPQILEVFEKEARNPLIYGSCHVTLHYLGQEEYKRKKDIATVFNECTATCLEGCYHGVIEGYFIQKKMSADSSDTEITNQFGAICKEKKSYQKIELYNQCLHGIGHALMNVTDNDLPRSLHLCDTLSDPTLCYTGVFMQNTNGQFDPEHPTQYLKANDLMYPCTILDEKYLSMCYALQVPVFDRATNHDWDKTATLCAHVPQKYQYECFMTMGGNSIGYTSDVRVLNADCMRLPTNRFRDACIQGVASNFVIRDGGNISLSTQLCEVVTGFYKRNCYSQIGTNITKWNNTPQKIATLCAQIKDKTDRNYCIHPALEEIIE